MKNEQKLTESNKFTPCISALRHLSFAIRQITDEISFDHRLEFETNKKLTLRNEFFKNFHNLN